MEITVCREGTAGITERQRWGYAAGVRCPACGALSVWAEETRCYEEENIGYLCRDCAHSFHYGGGYINDTETAQIVAALRTL